MRNRAIQVVNKATAPIRGYWFKVGTDPEKVLEAWQPEPSDRLPAEWGYMLAQGASDGRRRPIDPWTVIYAIACIGLCLIVLLAFAGLFIAELWPYAIKGGFQ